MRFVVQQTSFAGIAYGYATADCRSCMAARRATYPCPVFSWSQSRGSQTAHGEKVAVQVDTTRVCMCVYTLIWTQVDLNCLTRDFEKEQNDYYLHTAAWTDTHPQQLLGPATCFKRYDLNKVTLEELQVRVRGASAVYTGADHWLCTWGGARV